MTTHVTVRASSRSPLVTTIAILYDGDVDESENDCEILYDSKRVTRVATYTRVDGSQNLHDKVRLESLFHYNQYDQSVWLKDEGKDRSLTHLFETLVAARHVDSEGEYIVINASDLDPYDTEWLMDVLFKDKRKLKLLPLITEFLSDEASTDQLHQLFSDHPNRAQSFYAAVNYERLYKALDDFKRRVAEGCERCKNCIEGGRCPESEYQRYLEDHYWILGSEYSEMLERGLTWKGTQDFNMRRTADDHLEVIEIKTPEVVLFKQQNGRYIEKEEVVNAINQVDDYQKRVEDNWKALNRKYPDLRLDKVRGKVIIGRSNEHGAEEITALRRLNARLHGIEVITFDQLIANAERMLKILGEQRTTVDSAPDPAPPPNSSVNDIPF